MNDERFKTEKDNWWQSNDRRRGNVWTGLFLLVIGGLLMARTAGTDFPSWFFTWPMMLIALGLFLGLRHGFKKGAWFAPIIIGVVFLADKISDDLYLRPYLWPIMLIAAGLFILFGGRTMRNLKKDSLDGEGVLPGSYGGNPSSTMETTPDWERGYGDRNEVLDVTAIFSGVKKNVLSKSFKGGDLVAIMGGAEINLTKADFRGKIIIDSFTMFGGTKLIVPPDWDVQSQVVAIFGGVDDKRPPATQHDPSKVIVLDGTCIFGGIEIRSF